MLPTRELVGTGVTTTAIGFGCASLFRIPQRAARRLTLDVTLLPWDTALGHCPDVRPSPSFRDLR